MNGGSSGGSLARKMIDTNEFRTGLSDRTRRGTAGPATSTEDRAGIHLGLIALRFSTIPPSPRSISARIGVGSANLTALARAGYWQGRAAEAAGRGQEARAAYARAAEQSTSYYGQLRPRQARLAADRAEQRRRAAAAPTGWKSSVPLRCSMRSTPASSAIPIFGDMGDNGDPEALARPRRVDRAQRAMPAACC